MKSIKEKIYFHREKEDNWDLEEKLEKKKFNTENILWLGGSGTGLVKYHKKRGVIKQYTHDSLNRDSLINNDINSTSSKNKQAKEYGVKIITENECYGILNNN